jgi:hypothetical protein
MAQVELAPEVAGDLDRTQRFGLPSGGRFFR